MNMHNHTFYIVIYICYLKVHITLETLLKFCWEKILPYLYIKKLMCIRCAPFMRIQVLFSQKTIRWKKLKRIKSTVKIVVLIWENDCRYAPTTFQLDWKASWSLISSALISRMMTSVKNVICCSTYALLFQSGIVGSTAFIDKRCYGCKTFTDNCFQSDWKIIH